MADKPKKKWMKAAFADSHGQFKEKAEHAGKSTKEFAHEKEHAKGKLGKEARLAEVGMEAHHKKPSNKDFRRKMYGDKS